MKNLMANFTPIMQEIGAVSAAYNEGAWTDVGYMTGDILRAMTLKPKALEAEQVDRAMIAEIA